METILFGMEKRIESLCQNDQDETKARTIFSSKERSKNICT